MNPIPKNNKNSKITNFNTNKKYPKNNVRVMRKPDNTTNTAVSKKTYNPLNKTIKPMAKTSRSSYQYGNSKNGRSRPKAPTQIDNKEISRINKKRGPSIPPPDKNVIRIIPLGGVEEVGKNMTAIEIGNDIIVVDAGMQF